MQAPDRQKYDEQPCDSVNPWLCLGAVVILRILKEFIFPRLALRMDVRANESSIIDWVWPKSNPWFRAVGKANCAIMTVDVTQIRYSLKELTRSVLLKQRTISL